MSFFRPKWVMSLKDKVFGAPSQNIVRSRAITAMRSNDGELMQRCLDDGLDKKDFMNRPSPGFDHWWYAAFILTPEPLRVLLRDGDLDVNVPYESGEGWCAPMLGYAILQEKLGVAEVLLEAGATVGSKDMMEVMNKRDMSPRKQAQFVGLFLDHMERDADLSAVTALARERKLHDIEAMIDDHKAGRKNEKYLGGGKRKALPEARVVPLRTKKKKTETLALPAGDAASGDLSKIPLDDLLGELARRFPDQFAKAAERTGQVVRALSAPASDTPANSDNVMKLTS